MFGALRGNWMLAGVYLRLLPHLFRLPEQLKNPDCLRDQLAEHSRRARLAKPPPSSNASLPSVRIHVDSGAIGEAYERELDKARTELRRLQPTARPFVVTVALLVLVRAGAVAAAALQRWDWCVAVSALQFVVAPFSLFVAAAAFAALFPPLFAAHYVVYSLVAVATAHSPPWVADATHFALSGRFIAVFLALDQLACVWCALATPLGPSARFSWAKLAQHAAFGAFNAKSYTLVLLLLLRGQRVCWVVWLLDGWFGVTASLTSLIQRKVFAHWALLFYHQHRVAHLPRVYEHAHKFHHYLCDTTPFDAHLYGSGEPEEFFLLVWEAGMGLAFGVMPTTLGPNTLLLSMGNKIGHTRKMEGSMGVNHHADHHVVHNKNFGIYNCLLDMYFNTNHPSNTRYAFADFAVTKHVADHHHHHHHHHPQADARGGKTPPTAATGVWFELELVPGMLCTDELYDKFYAPSLGNMVRALVDVARGQKKA